MGFLELALTRAIAANRGKSPFFSADLIFNLLTYYSSNIPP